MNTNALERFTAAVRDDWGPISTHLVARCRHQLAELTMASAGEDWLAALHAETPDARELVRDATQGFLLLAHTEQQGLYRPPHDHGRAWVAYAVQSGALEVGTYAKVTDDDGRIRLVRREMHVLLPGDARVYLPGDIHDTRCISQSALLFRFTERDLRHEDKVERRLTRFVWRDGEWTAPEQ